MVRRWTRPRPLVQDPPVPRPSAPLAVLLAALAGCAAGAGESGYYGTVRAGAWTPTGGGDTRFGAGGEIAIGRSLLPRLSAEVAVGFSRSRGTFRLGSDGQGSPPFTTARLDADVIPLVASLRLSQPVRSAELFLLAGGGGFRVEPSSPPAPVPAADRRPHTQLGGQLGAGALYRFSEDLSLGLEGRWYRSVPSWTGARGPVESAGLLLGVGFRF
jgi:opacity protein-like surface antigen